MAFSFSSLFNSKKTHTNNDIIPKIKYNGGTKFAENKTNEVYLDIEELGGFPFIKTAIIGDFSVKVKRTGCTLTFIFENESLILSSDNTSIESNQIKNTNVHFTEIDFELIAEEVEKIKNENIAEIQYTFKDKTISFIPITA